MVRRCWNIIPHSLCLFGCQTYQKLTTFLAVELEEILAAPCDSHEAIDNSLRSYLAFTTNFKGMTICSKRLQKRPRADKTRGVPPVGLRCCALLIPTARIK